MPSSIDILAPAKLNLALSVGEPDDSGMHPICSWMVTVDLFDELRVTRLDDDRLSHYAILWHEEAKKTDDIDWSITADLAVRAHLALEKHLGRRLPVQMKLDKRIPIGGGLGGGSTDAAAMLRAVDSLFELNQREDELIQVARTLGSDVPFFLQHGSAIVEGCGERIGRLNNLPNLHAVIAFPNAMCATGQVYEKYDEISPGPLRSHDVRNLARAAVFNQAKLFNDLAEPAMQIAPQIRDDAARLRELAERAVHITGSGVAVFVLCDDQLHAEALANACEHKLDLPAVAVKSVFTESCS